MSIKKIKDTDKILSYTMFIIVILSFKNICEIYDNRYLNICEMIVILSTILYSTRNFKILVIYKGDNKIPIKQMICIYYMLIYKIIFIALLLFININGINGLEWNLTGFFVWISPLVMYFLLLKYSYLSGGIL